VLGRFVAVQTHKVLTQRGYIRWADIGMVLVAVLLFLAVLVMVTDR
jgi:hypothetical protein